MGVRYLSLASLAVIATVLVVVTKKNEDVPSRRLLGLHDPKSVQFKMQPPLTAGAEAGQATSSAPVSGTQAQVNPNQQRQLNLVNEMLAQQHQSEQQKYEEQKRSLMLQQAQLAQLQQRQQFIQQQMPEGHQRMLDLAGQQQQQQITQQTRSSLGGPSVAHSAPVSGYDALQHQAAVNQVQRLMATKESQNQLQLLAPQQRATASGSETAPGAGASSMAGAAPALAPGRSMLATGSYGAVAASSSSSTTDAVAAIAPQQEQQNRMVAETTNGANSVSTVTQKENSAYPSLQELQKRALELEALTKAAEQAEQERALSKQAEQQKLADEAEAAEEAARLAAQAETEQRNKEEEARKINEEASETEEEKEARLAKTRKEFYERRKTITKIGKQKKRESYLRS